MLSQTLVTRCCVFVTQRTTISLDRTLSWVTGSRLLVGEHLIVWICVLTLVALLEVLSLVTFIQEMIIKISNLNDIGASIARGKHQTGFKVVAVESISDFELFVSNKAELTLVFQGVTFTVLHSFLRLLVGIVVLLIIFRTSITTVLSCPSCISVTIIFAHVW